MSVVLDSRPLSVSDRCDVCQAQAYIRVIMKTGSELLFCAHHGRENESQLRAVALEYDDQSSNIA